MKPKIENKEQLIKAARIAFALPSDFWDEVKKRMDIRKRSLVEPREKSH